MRHSEHYPHYHSLGVSISPKSGWPILRSTLEEGWVEDPEEKHQLWIPTEWTASSPSSGWLHNITTLLLHLDKPVIIIF